MRCNDQVCATMRRMRIENTQKYSSTVIPIQVIGAVVEVVALLNSIALILERYVVLRFSLAQQSHRANEVLIMPTIVLRIAGFQ